MNAFLDEVLSSAYTSIVDASVDLIDYIPVVDVGAIVCDYTREFSTYAFETYLWRRLYYYDQRFLWTRSLTFALLYAAVDKCSQQLELRRWLESIIGVFHPLRLEDSVIFAFAYDRCLRSCCYYSERYPCMGNSGPCTCNDPLVFQRPSFQHIFWDPM